MRGRGGKRAPQSCRDQLQNPCMRKVNQREKLCTSNAEHASLSSLGPVQEDRDWAWLSMDIWTDNKFKMSFVFRPPEETGTISRDLVIWGTSQWQSLQGSTGSWQEITLWGAVPELLPPLKPVGIIWDNFQDWYYLCHASQHLSCRSKLSTHLKHISKHYLLGHLEVLRQVNLFAIYTA